MQLVNERQYDCIYSHHPLTDIRHHDNFLCNEQLIYDETQPNEDTVPVNNGRI